MISPVGKFFAHVGLPSYIQSDQGSNFMSGVFRQVMYELGISHISHLHITQSQGALERWYQTLKTMMRIYCFETEKDWVEGINLLLLAAQESVQESLGFGPFELVFGHTVRGPFQLLKEKLLSGSGQSINLLQYVSDFPTKFFRACELTRAYLCSSQKSMKNEYDVDAVERNFSPGQKVLALLPVSGIQLNSRLFGPYVIDNIIIVIHNIIITWWLLPIGVNKDSYAMSRC